jgi:dipeptidyl-peptidase III
MQTIKLISSLAIASSLFASCSNAPKENKNATEKTEATSPEILGDRFADIQTLHYEITGFDELSQQQKQLAYYLYMAGMSGRDIFYDQKYKHNLRIRKTIETVLQTYSGDKGTNDYKEFLTYAKRFFFANGIHHHYSSDKMIPAFNAAYLKELLAKSDQTKLPLEGMAADAYADFLTPILFDQNIDAKNVDLSANKDRVVASANNFYEGVTEKEVDAFYKKMTLPNVKEQPAWGYNSKVVKEKGVLVEKPWMVGGMYGAAMSQMVGWLQKAVTVAENETQKKTLEALIKYYQSGNPKDYDDYCISWVRDTESRIDFANGFIEVYMDPMHRKGSYEAVLSMKDMEASKRIAAIAKEAQWFEDNSPIAKEHKKDTVKGITAKVITVINEAGDAAPATPIGINLPNQEWIRESHGSKSVSLGNIVAAYNYARAKSPMIDEFGENEEVKKRYREYASLAGDLHTDMHEVIGHASGIINPGVGSTDVTLKNYASTLEEARADLVALYYAMDQKLVDIGVTKSTDVGKTEYDYYIMNGMMTQLYRIEPGKNIEESHMRNRQLVAAYAVDKGKKENVIERITKEGKTYFRINDYNKLRTIFGELLHEIQRIKSKGDYNAGKNLVENYGVIADQALLTEVHKRYEALNIAPYMGFIQPKLVPIMDGDKITDVKVEYNEDFLEQMLRFGKEFSFLPTKN